MNIMQTALFRIRSLGLMLAMAGLAAAAGSPPATANKDETQLAGTIDEGPPAERTAELPPGVILNDDILSYSTRGIIGVAWPDGIVPIVFDGITSSERTTHLEAMDVWNYSGADVTFIYRTNEYNYIRLVPTTESNSSFVGMIGDPSDSDSDGDYGEQELKVNSPGQYTAAHEQCHALGFRHEQSRSDRDSYVEINCGNIDPDKYHNFTIGSGVFPLDTPYDLDSIMHYGECDFTVCSDLVGDCPCILGCENGDGDGYCSSGACEDNGRTIDTIDDDQQGNIGQRDHLSALDILDMMNGYGIGGQNKQYVDAAGFPAGPTNSGIFNPSGFPREQMALHPHNTIWVRGGTYSNAQAAGIYGIPGTLRAHGGTAVLGGG